MSAVMFTNNLRLWKSYRERASRCPLLFIMFRIDYFDRRSILLLYNRDEDEKPFEAIEAFDAFNGGSSSSVLLWK